MSKYCFLYFSIKVCTKLDYLKFYTLCEVGLGYAACMVSNRISVGGQKVIFDVLSLLTTFVTVLIL